MRNTFDGNTALDPLECSKAAECWEQQELSIEIIPAEGVKFLSAQPIYLLQVHCILSIQYTYTQYTYYKYTVPALRLPSIISISAADRASFSAPDDACGKA